MDEILPGGLNLGLTTRSEYTGRSRIAELISPIHVDMFFQEKLMINGVDLRMRFIRAKNDFCLMSDGAVEYRVSIVSANVFIKKVSVAPGVKLAHARALNQANVKYPVDRVCLKNVSIAAGSRICTQDNHKEFGDGYALFCFNLEADEGCGQHVSLVRTGNVRLEARFRAALATTVNLICYAVYDSVIEISNRRQVLLDYY
jgi:hypothetical protein